MKLIKYFLEFFIVIFFFLIFKIIGLKNSSNLGCFIFKKIGPLIRNQSKIRVNIKSVFKNIDDDGCKEIINKMWCNYGRIFGEYMHLNILRNNKLKNIKILNADKFNEIKSKNKPIVFFSGHFSNFELLAMVIEQNNFNISAIYRPLNNIFLNPVMKYLRVKYLCKNQIPKAIPGKRNGGTRMLLKQIKQKKNIALMIDQKVNEGIVSELFGRKALTLNIPAQLAIKYGYMLIPLEIKREKKIEFSIKINDPIEIDEVDDQYSITKKLNEELESMIKNNPSQWIWTHDRWRI